jgi:uncharacterized phage-associated protein
MESLIQGKPLVSLHFEAWQYGPVMPSIYHQFKDYGPNQITGRATKIDPDSGDRVVFDYKDMDINVRFLEDIVSRYGRLSASALIALSHEPGGAWDKVWNSKNQDQFGMIIPNELIAGSALGPLGERGSTTQAKGGSTAYVN